MIRLRTYGLMCILLLLAVSAGQSAAQNCDMNMLVIPDQSSYASVSQPSNIPSGAMTIECWAKAASLQTGAALIEYGEAPASESFSLWFASGQKIAATFMLNNGSVTITGNAVSNVAQWHHYCVTFSPNDSIRLYVDSILVAAAATNGSSVSLQPYTFFVGHSAITGTSFVGDIDEVRIWSVARTQTQIFGAMSTPLLGNEAGLKLYYKFDDDPAAAFIHNFSGKGSELGKQSNAYLDIGTSPMQGPAAAGYMIGATKSVVNFSDLTCSDTESTIVEVFNRGSEQIDVQFGFLRGTYFSIASSIGFPIPPGDTTRTAQINIQANITKPGVYSDTLVINSTTVCGGQVRVPVVIKKDSIGISFVDSVFNLYKQLNCNLPLERSTYLQNTGTKPVTVTSLGFPAGSPITILSPKLPFEIAVGASEEIRFRLESGPSTLINEPLRAGIKECSRQSTIVFHGWRVVQQVGLPASVIFPPVHLPAIAVTDTAVVLVKNIGTSILYFSPSISLAGSGSFKLLSPTSGLVRPLEPDSTVSLKVQFTASNDCGDFATAIELHFQDPRDCPLDTIIPVSATVLGPLVETPSDTIDLGASCVVGRDTSITLKNNSGRQILLGAPIFSTDSIFTLTSAAVFPKMLNDGDSVSLHFIFDPAKPGEYTVRTRFPLSPCGEKMMTFTSIYGIGKFSASDSIVDFGNICNSAAETKSVRVKNLSGRDVIVTDSSIQHSSDFRITSPSLPFAFAANEEKTVTVEYTPSANTITRGEIDLFDSGCFVTRILAKALHEHANIQSNQTNVKFDTVCAGDTSIRSLILQNLGHGAVTILSGEIIGNDAKNFHVFADTQMTIQSGSVWPIRLQFVPTENATYVALLQLVLGPCGDTVQYALWGTGGPLPSLTISDTVLDFGAVKIGEADSLCLTISNPSCTPITIEPSALGTLLAPFEYSTLSLPQDVMLSHPVRICFTFAPHDSGSASSSVTISTNTYTFVVRLRGKATKVDLKFPDEIDFGDVAVDSSKTVYVYVDNVGDAQPLLSVGSEPTSPFEHLSRNTTVVSPHIELDSFRFAPTVCQPFSSSYTFKADDSTYTIKLVGRGVCAGPLFSVSKVDFGNVRLTDSSLATVAVSAVEGFPVTIVGTDIASPVFYIRSVSNSTLHSSADTAHIVIAYVPTAERIDADSLILLTSSASPVSLPLYGTGVQSHLVLSDSLIDFGDVPVQKPSTPRLLTIRNTGGYPLRVLSAVKSNAVFDTTTGLITQSPIAPYSSANISVVFTPQRAKPYNDSLLITADAPERQGGVSLRGKGVFAPFGYPEITYAVSHVAGRVGDVINIPVYIGGSQYNLVSIDSFFVDVAFDSTVMYVRDVSSAQANVSISFKRLSPGKIHIAGKGTLASVPLQLCTINAEALLGPNDSTGLIITSSDPINTATIQSSSGSFVVTDCGNYRGGIAFKGNYSLAPSIPNPTNGIIAISYELGIASHVTITLYDQLGRNVRTLLNADRGFGKHELVANIADLPTGEYYYLIESLDYRATEKLQLLK